MFTAQTVPHVFTTTCASQRYLRIGSYIYILRKQVDFKSSRYQRQDFYSHKI